VPRPSQRTATVLAENRRHYELVVEMARRYAEQGDVEHVLRAGLLAANYAWTVPVGLLSDLRLERTVVHAVRGSGTVTVDGGRRTGRVLHVLSEAYSVGGHTRLAWRWMARDPRTSDVVLTNQHGPVPERLVESVRASGGELFDLRATPSPLLDRARGLRELMDRADVVVLHVHPYDVVALAAVNLPGSRPPVVYENHADLTFWLGVAGADLLCDLRSAAHGLDIGLRGVPAERIAVLPMPIEALPSSAGEGLRRQLGIRPDSVVAVTVSADWKMAPSWGRAGMHRVVDRLLHWCPQLSVVLVGASPNADWGRLAKRYPGRVFPVGRVPDPAPYFDLADIYLDSYPMRSCTSALEGAVLGLPVAALADLPVTHAAYGFQAASPGLDGLPVATSAEKLAVAVRRLALDAGARRERGLEARDAVLSQHDGPGWLEAAEALYERAHAVPAIDVDDLGESPTDEAYGAMLLEIGGAAPVTHDPRQFTGPLGDLFDPTMEMDLLAALLRGEGSSIQVRIAPTWQDRTAWTTRLLAIAAEYSRLTLSLPFLPDDDAQGTRSVARLTELLAAVGQTTEDCGDIRLETTMPSRGALSLNGELSLTDDALDRLQALLASPLWEPEEVSAEPEREPLAV
jgi:hypothetical protein